MKKTDQVYNFIITKNIYGNKLITDPQFNSPYYLFDVNINPGSIVGIFHHTNNTPINTSNTILIQNVNITNHNNTNSIQNIHTNNYNALSVTTTGSNTAGGAAISYGTSVSEQ